MAENFTIPTITDVREGFAAWGFDPMTGDDSGVALERERFDRWLAEHDREVGQKAQDEFRRFLWIIADRHIGGVVISDAALAAVPSLPGIAVEYDPARRMTTVRATSTDTGPRCGACDEPARGYAFWGGHGLAPSCGEHGEDFKAGPVSDDAETP